MLPSLKDLVNRQQNVEFVFYRDGNLWYQTGDLLSARFVFPVPIVDAGTGTFKATDKSVYFMRWIRRHLEELQEEERERAAARAP
jgi:hypothetical protein